MNKKFPYIIMMLLVLIFSACTAETADTSSDVSSVDSVITQSDDASSDTTVSKEESDLTSSDKQTQSETSSAASSSGNQLVSSKTTQTASSKNTQTTEKEDTRPAASVSDFTPLSMEEYYCYNKLTDSQKSAYRVIYDMVKNYVSGDKMINGVTPEDISIAYTAVHNDNPDFFWMGQGYAIITKTSGSNTSYGIRTNPDGTGFITSSKADCDSKQSQLNQKIDSIISSVVKKGMTKDEIVKAFHDYICENTVYNYNYKTGEKNKYNWTAYGALIEKTSVCEGYSKALQILLYRVGIQNTVIGGIGDGGAHQWSAVKTSDWKTIDVTWDDHKNGGFGYTYYNKNSINPSSKHKAYVHISKAGLEEIQQGKFNFFTELK